MLKVDVKQSGNRIEIRSSQIHMWFEISGFELPDKLDQSFALWFMLPIAMKNRLPIHINGVADRTTIRNIEELSRIWELWTPDQFRAIRASAQNYSPQQAELETAPLYFYSGGVDSTYMCLERDVIHPRTSAITIQGMDYKLSRIPQFESLIGKTQAFVDEQGMQRIVLKTNAGSVLGNLRFNYGFLLAGIASLFSESFGRIFLAADYRNVQSMLAFPRTINCLTNHLLIGANYSLDVMNQEIARTTKIARIASNHIALNSLAFCSDGNLRPANCGRCDKCIRTKAMFLVSIGEIPKIFICNQFGKRHVLSLNFQSKHEMAFFSELIQRAAQENRTHLLLGIPDRLESAIRGLKRRNSKEKRLGRFFNKSRKRFIWSRAGEILIHDKS